MSAFIRSALGRSSINLPLFQLNGTGSGGDHIAANGVGLGLDVGLGDVWATNSRATDETTYGALRLVSHIRQRKTLTEATNNIALLLADTDLYDTFICSFGSTDAAKTITLDSNVSLWQGRDILLAVHKTATAGSRAVTLVSNGSESTLIKATGDAAGAATATLISAATAAKDICFRLVGANGLLYVFAN